MKNSSSVAHGKSRRIVSYSASVLSWPAWLRVIAILPVCALLWLGVAWALAENIA